MTKMIEKEKKSAKHTKNTKDRILAAAVVLFENNGFEGASVRAICAEAGANIAAINYYFGSKESLYGEVVKSVFHSADGSDSMPLLSENPTDPVTQLCAWIEWHVGRYLPERNSTLSTFIRREIANPSPLLQEIVDVTILPSFKALKEMVTAILPADATDDRISLQCLQINGPTMLASVLQPINSRMPGFQTSGISTEMVIRQAQVWALAGLRASGAEISEDRFPSDSFES